jgi:hypothetical protein
LLIAAGFLQFSASSKALFGPDFPSVKGFKGFQDFDNGFPLLAASMPAFMCKKGMNGREQALDVLEQWYQGWLDKREDEKQQSTATEYPAYELLELYRMKGFTRRDIASLMLAEAWALLANGQSQPTSISLRQMPT